MSNQTMLVVSLLQNEAKTLYIYILYKKKKVNAYNII